MTKKFVFIVAAAAAMTLASCNKSAEIEAPVAPADNAITFATYTAGTTRTTAVESLASFNAYAYKTGSNSGVKYFGPVEFTKNASEIYEAAAGNKQYWPSEALTFYAINETITANYNDGFEFSFDTATESRAKDLVFAKVKDQTKPSQLEAVKLNFDHILAWISSVSFKGAESGCYYEVSSVKLNYTIKGKYNAASYTSSTSSTPSTPGTWTAETPSTDELKEVLVGATTSINGTTATDAVDFGFCIPMTAGPTLTVEYKVNQVLAGMTYNVSDPSTYVTIADFTGSTKAKTNSLGPWVGGTKYAYTITLPTGGDEITFAVERIADWGTATSSDITFE